MADRIRLLPEVVANQIAAGEVVNRPASVVKEMMENAIDAGARSVKVNFRDGGRELIQIVDDGCGMSPIDARMAFDRHATSKIRSAEDIYALRTFGFRGEALASIAAVAQVELRTRQEGATRWAPLRRSTAASSPASSPRCAPSVRSSSCATSSTTCPRGRSSLDKSTVSASQIKAEFQRVALCNPDIAFELFANDAPVYALGAASLAGRIVDIVGRHIKQNLLEVEARTSIASVRGYIGRPAAAKRRNTEQYLFVNGRYFKSSYLTSAVLKGYEKLIPENCQPSYFLYLEIDPARIDVNVHPQKTEVKFADEEAVWQIVNAAVRETLAKTGAVPLMDFDSESDVEIPVLNRSAVYGEPRAMSNFDYNPFRAEYIDPSAPDPNVDFTGFDIPRAAGGATTPGGDAMPWRSAGGSPHGGSGGRGVRGVRLGRDVPDRGRGGRQRPQRVVRRERPRLHPLGRGGRTAAPRHGAAGPLHRSAARGRRLCRGAARRTPRRRRPAPRPRTGPLRGVPPPLGQRRLAEPAAALPRAAGALGGGVRAARRARRGVRGAGLRHRLLRRGRRGGEGHSRADLPADAVDRLLYDLLQAFAAPVSLADVRRERIAAVLARNGAKCAPRNATREETQALLDRLAAAGNVGFSPSGKRIAAEFTPEELRAKLG